MKIIIRLSLVLVLFNITMMLKTPVVKAYQTTSYQEEKELESHIYTNEEKRTTTLVAVAMYLVLSPFYYFFIRSYSDDYYVKEHFWNLFITRTGIMIIACLLNMHYKNVYLVYILLDILGWLLTSIVFFRFFQHTFLNKTISTVFPEIDYSKYGLEEESLKEELSNIFIKVQTARMEKDEDTIIENCRDNLSDTYRREIKSYQNKHQKNILNDFKVHSMSIIHVEKKNNITDIQALLCITFYDYVMDEDTSEVISGNSKHPDKCTYMLDFIKDSKKENKFQLRKQRLIR